MALSSKAFPGMCRKDQSPARALPPRLAGMGVISCGSASRGPNEKHPCKKREGKSQRSDPLPSCPLSSGYGPSAVLEQPRCCQVCRHPARHCTSGKRVRQVPPAGSVPQGDMCQPLCGFLTSFWHSCTPGSMQGELGVWAQSAGCLPRGIPCAVLWQTRRGSVTNGRAGAWAAVGCARLAHTYLIRSLAFPLPAPPLQALQPHRSAISSHPWQQIPVPATIIES